MRRIWQANSREDTKKWSPNIIFGQAIRPKRIFIYQQKERLNHDQNRYITRSHFQKLPRMFYELFSPIWSKSQRWLNRQARQPTWGWCRAPSLLHLLLPCLLVVNNQQEKEKKKKKKRKRVKSDFYFMCFFKWEWGRNDVEESFFRQFFPIIVRWKRVFEEKSKAGSREL